MPQQVAKSDASSFLGLDSLMDVLTNLIGGLCLIVIYAALTAFAAKGKITTPLVAPSDTEPVQFECRGNTVIDPGFDELAIKWVRELKRLRDKGLSDDHVLAALEEAELRNAYYRFEPRHLRYGQQHYEKIEGATGEPAGVLVREGSEYRARFAGLDPSKHHLFFHVRSDSFAVFHTARRIAVEMGFKVGWEPWHPTVPIVFNNGDGIPMNPS